MESATHGIAMISTFGEKWQKTSKFVYESQARKNSRSSTGKVVGKGMAAEGLTVARPIWLDGSMKSKGTTKPSAQWETTALETVALFRTHVLRAPCSASETLRFDSLSVQDGFPISKQI